MKLPRVRLTVRELIFVVTVAGIGAGFEVRLMQRRARFLDLASAHASQVVPLVHTWALTAPRRICIEGWETANGRVYSAQEGALIERKNEWHRTVSAKYRLAANRPWLPVEPDPPEPE
jgi:hypothetical protein